MLNTTIIKYTAQPVFSTEHSTTTVKMAWDRLDVAFMSVSPVERCALPRCMTWSISGRDCKYYSKWISKQINKNMK